MLTLASVVVSIGAITCVLRTPFSVTGICTILNAPPSPRQLHPSDLKIVLARHFPILPITIPGQTPQLTWVHAISATAATSLAVHSCQYSNACSSAAHQSQGQQSDDAPSSSLWPLIALNIDPATAVVKGTFFSSAYTLLYAVSAFARSLIEPHLTRLYF